MLTPHRGYLDIFSFANPAHPSAFESARSSASASGSGSGSASGSGSGSASGSAPGSGSESGSKSRAASGSVPGSASASQSRWQTALLEELIYERVRLNVDLLELVDFERDLAASIERALEACGAREDRERLAREHLERAWARLERDWRAARERAAADDDLQCPLCGELTALDP